ncbi:MAG: alanine--tRNA ligase [Patescibacteria group bacterium]
MTVNEIRKKYLDFFKNKNHAILPSASLVPENDPTTLFTGSGMQPLLPYFLGEPHPAGKRVVNSQKSFRAQDIEEVGDNRHTTFFEMLGNWSFGDYFKKEQITWIFEFLTKELDLDAKRLYFTCYAGNEVLGIPRDTEAAELWQKELSNLGIDAEIAEGAEEKGMQGARIFYYGDKKNWWSRVGAPENMPEGEPGGPDTEMFWDFGAEQKLHETSAWRDKPCHPNCDCGRFMEVGNNVFMEYVKRGEKFQKLPAPNVDFGAGLERLAAAVKNNPDMFQIDAIFGLIGDLEELSGKNYDSDKVAFRVIADHMRAAIFLMADGVMPGNADQSYFVRRLIRRSVRFANKINLPPMFLSKLVERMLEQYGDVYPEIENNFKLIEKAIDDEESRFRSTLERGMKIFEKNNRGGEISGEDAFILFTTHGFPIELTEEIAKDKGIRVSRQSFDEAMKKHRDTSRAGSEKKFKGGLAGEGEMEIKYHTATHLLHRALREILGEHVYQRGSNITPERLRFDFTHPIKMSPEEIRRTEDWVNDKIKADYPVKKEEVKLAEARVRGAIGLFGEKYGDIVSIYHIGDNKETASLEFCGGPHVERTGILGHFHIIKEEAVASGVRRIKAVLK